jgi:ABC-type uncharacterized transport system substrate-binding protein
MNWKNFIASTALGSKNVLRFKKSNLSLSCSQDDSNPQLDQFKPQANDLFLVFFSNQKEYNLEANVVIIQIRYDTTYYYDVVGCSSSDVTSGAL